MMTDKRMLIIDEATVTKIDENRGDMNRTEFINFLIDSQFQEEDTAPTSKQYVSRKEYLVFTNEMKDHVRHFLDYCISNGLKKGVQPGDGNFTELMQELESFSTSKVKPKKSK